MNSLDSVSSNNRIKLTEEKRIVHSISNHTKHYLRSNKFRREPTNPTIPLPAEIEFKDNALTTAEQYSFHRWPVNNADFHYINLRTFRTHYTPSD